MPDFDGDGKADWHFIEVMACPGGCIGGGLSLLESLSPQKDISNNNRYGLFIYRDTALGSLVETT